MFQEINIKKSVTQRRKVAKTQRKRKKKNMKGDESTRVPGFEGTLRVWQEVNDPANIDRF